MLYFSADVEYNTTRIENNKINFFNIWGFKNNIVRFLQTSCVMNFESQFKSISDLLPKIV